MSKVALRTRTLSHELGPRRRALRNQPMIRSLRGFRAWQTSRRGGGELG